VFKCEGCSDSLSDVEKERQKFMNELRKKAKEETE